MAALPAALVNPTLQPLLDFGLQPTDCAASEAYGLGKGALRDAQIDGAARKASSCVDSRKSKDRMRHVRTSLGVVEHDAIAAFLGVGVTATAVKSYYLRWKRLS